jgi:hypothetical protein
MKWKLVVCGFLSILIWIGSGGIVAGLEPVRPDGKKEGETQPSVWMKLKLEYAQKILQGLAEADFDRIAENAEAMQGFNRFEGLLRRRPSGYAAQLQIFKEANAELIRQASRESLDGATLAFTQLTISCVNCHKRLREEPAAAK